MENIVLTIHLILALCLIGVVLLQRSEGGGLGMGGGGGTMSARGAATALGKMTWGLAIAFICTSIWLTVIAAQNTSDSSVLDRLGTSGAPVTDGDQSPSVPELGGDLLPPPTAAPDASLPPRAE
ncbi:protein translocase subunit secG [Palleronia marisminoris]|uniref:Protein-export membrane protein SecG n=1 Tax=Palleronia marisminoris TaxID=315423 RepID=A0A1Y5SZ29_9RHOB|nr:preprotein translocase subunit SecG [Palleronia marisminoris]SFG99134.1 protein translocase subunit secG [Palleronia marisminoris]SLN48372.1 preprotein translocase subunit SecG [Palleronia marisminoris]